MPDVVIVGGGIIGAASAYELTRRGVSVTLFERAELAAGASGRNQGWFVLSSDEHLGPMSRASVPVYEEIVDTSPVTVRFDREAVGHLLIARDPAGIEMAREHATQWAATGVHAERLDAAELREAEPALASSIIEAWLLDQGRRIDPAALTVALALRAREQGADLRTHVNVRALIESASRVTGVVTDDGLVAADVVVLAAGPWSAAFTRPLGLPLPVNGARGWIVELSAEPGTIRHHIEEEDGTWDEEHAVPTAAHLASGFPREPAVSALLHQSHDDAIVCGASHHPALRAEPEDVGAPARIVERAISVAPPLADLEVRGIRWGIRPMSPDGRPIVGWLADGLLAATGHGPEGILLGGGTAALVASLVTGDDPPFPAGAFDPKRFG
ncbi:MAG TPA: FAD-binding oxidoreductase [Actinomycetota bacterium]|jgi:glycine/D-amino acid oxidase-like deaminating enzyme